MVKDWFRVDCRIHPIETIKAKKPFWLSDKTWIEGLEDAAVRAPKPQLEETSDVSSWHIHRLLNSGKPKSLPDDIWAKILPELTDGFISRLTTLAERGYRWSHPEEVRKLLALPKPIAVFDEKWNKLKEELGVIYSTAVITRAMLYSEFTEPLAALDNVQLDQKDREKIRKTLQALYSVHIINQILKSLDPVETLNRADLRPLPESDAEALQAFVCGRRYSALTQAIRSIIRGSGLDSNPPRLILQEEWADLKRIEKETLSVRNAYEEKRAELDTREAQVMQREAESKALKTTVLRQLDVINTFINDPTVLNRIEEYDTVFAPGNLLNLRKLAEHLRTCDK
jgi:hypothetical protein